MIREDSFNVKSLGGYLRSENAADTFDYADYINGLLDKAKDSGLDLTEVKQVVHERLKHFQLSHADGAHLDGFFNVFWIHVAA